MPVRGDFQILKAACRARHRHSSPVRWPGSCRLCRQKRRKPILWKVPGNYINIA